MDEDAHELLGLRGGGRRFEPPALEVHERLTVQSYRIGWSIPIACANRPAFDHVVVLDMGLDGPVRARFARELDGVSQLLEQRKLETSQHRLDVARRVGRGLRDAARRVRPRKRPQSRDRLVVGGE